MISFMVIAAPRSGTAWAANWLTTDTSLCLHGLNARKHYSEWDQIQSDRMLGVSDPSISRFPAWLNAHPARKVILHRDPAEIAFSLGMDEVPADTWGLDKVKGMHVEWTDLFDKPVGIYEYLLQRPFDAQRHEMLKAMQVTCMPKRMTFDKGVFQRLLQELQCS